MDFLTAFLLGLLWLPGRAAAVAPVGVANKGFAGCCHIAGSFETATGLLHIAAKCRSGTTLNCHAAIAVNLPLRGQHTVGFN